MKVYKGFLSLITCILLLQILPMQAGAQNSSQQGSNGYALAAAVGGVALAAAGACYLWNSSSDRARNVRRWFRRTLGMKQNVHQAAAQEDLEVIQAQLARTAQLKFGNEVAQISLEAAARLGNLEVVQKFLNDGADVNGERSWETPLFFAAANGHEGVVRALVDAGAKLDCKIDGAPTPLCAAAEKGHEAVVQCLLEAGASPNSTLDSGDSRHCDGHIYTFPLHEAVMNGHLEVVRRLLRAGANVNTRALGCPYVPSMGPNWSPFDIALVQNKSVEMIQELIVRGADPIELEQWRGARQLPRFLKRRVAETDSVTPLAKKRLQAINEALNVLPDPIVDTLVGPLAALSETQIAALKQARAEQRAVRASHLGQ